MPIGVRRCAIRRVGGSLAPEPQVVPIGVRRCAIRREGGSLAPGPRCVYWCEKVCNKEGGWLTGSWAQVCLLV